MGLLLGNLLELGENFRFRFVVEPVAVVLLGAMLGDLWRRRSRRRSAGKALGETMKVLLVNPDYDIERYIGRHFDRMGWVMPPMGVLYLAAQLECDGIDVRVYDAQVADRSLAEYGPDIVGITCATALVESTFAAPGW